MGAKLGSHLRDIEHDLGKGQLVQRIPDGASHISGCREYREWKLQKGRLEICLDDQQRAIDITFSASSPVAAYSDVVLLADTFKTATRRIPASASRERTAGEGMAVQSMKYLMPGGIKVDVLGSARDEGPTDTWDDSMVVSTVTIAYLSRFPFAKREP